MKKVTRYETADGELHLSEDSAADHERDLERLEQANEMLYGGATVGAILERFGVRVPDDILFRVTTSSEFVIRHWQCRDTPGYRPVRFELRLYSMLVHGDAGCWSGTYGNTMSLNEVARYARNEKSVLEPEPKGE